MIFFCSKNTHSKENFMESKLYPYKNFCQMHYFLINCRMNERIHNFSIRLHVLGWTTQAVLPSFTFMTFYSRTFAQWHLPSAKSSKVVISRVALRLVTHDAASRVNLQRLYTLAKKLRVFHQCCKYFIKKQTI